MEVVGNKTKGRISKTGVSRKQSTSNVPLFGKFDVLCFFETPVFRFALLPHYRRGSVNTGKMDGINGKLQIYVFMC